MPSSCLHDARRIKRVVLCAEERFSLKGSEVSGSLCDVVRFVQRTLRKRPTPTMTLLGARCCIEVSGLSLSWNTSDSKCQAEHQPKI
jgi:hypothetical protein